ncbi:TSC22 domain family protein 2 [Merluccius polli]|uniref:TSC22 domain family protein 2 n=1 Tax=Merluccius polli TaxID=89951 RepID=A0AA47N9I5_MERPO|nr:TSC22 domain family protein 2 [Merluccius polli]
MSKMPAKKKSCFQITSVTQAQVAASSATDDTESPDESRTEDVSSEIFDVSRQDYGPACDSGSSEEALNNVGETEPPQPQQPPQPPHVPQAGQPPSASPSNPNGGFRKPGYAGSASGGGPGLETGSAPIAPQQQNQHQQHLPPGPTNVSQSAAGTNSSTPPPAPSSTTTSSSSTAAATSTMSCSSRFRVIKLDHGTGEPFRRGRWTCTEFYEKDSSSSEGSAMGRSVDGIRHAGGGAAASDPAADRDSGLGHTGGSTVAPATNSGQGAGLGSLADMVASSSASSLPASRMQALDALQQQQQQQQIHQAAFSSSGGGTIIKSIAVSSQQQQQPAVGLFQPPGPQIRLPVGHGSLSQGGIHIQKSPQPGSYSQQQQQQLPLAHHHLPGQASPLTSSQTEYYQQQQQQQQLHASPMQAAASPNHSLTLGQPVGQGPSPIMTPAVGGGSSSSGQSGEMAGPGGGGGVALPAKTAASLLQPPPGGMGDIGGSLLIGGSALQQQAVGQYTAPGQPQPHNLQHAASGGQNVPAASSSVPTTTVPAGAPSASSAAMPNLMTSGLLMAQQSQLSRSNVGAFGVFGALVPGRDLMKPLIPESLHLSSPTVNSLFGIPIPMDGDEDR